MNEFELNGMYIGLGVFGVTAACFAGGAALRYYVFHPAHGKLVKYLGRKPSSEEHKTDQSSNNPTGGLENRL